MKIILVITLSAILLSCSFAAQARDEAEILRNEIEVRGLYRGDPTVRGYFEKAITENVSLNLVAFKAHGWDEVTVGPTYYITPEMSVSVGIGTSRYMASDEGEKSFHKTGSAFWFWKTDTWEAEVLVERYSRDPQPWYREGYLQKRIAPRLFMGVFARTDSGWGPRLAYNINKTIDIWVSPIVNRTGDAKAILGAKVSF